MATFGKIDTVGDEYVHFGGGVFACRYYLERDAIAVTQMNAYLRKSLEAGTVFAKCAIYRDLDGVPNELIAITEERQIPSATFGWIAFPFTTSFALSPGYYWLAIMTNGYHFYIHGAGLANQLFYRDRSYAFGFPNPFGTPMSKLSGDYAIHAVYTPIAVTSDLTVIAEVGGTTDPAPGVYPTLEDTTVSIKAIPNTGYAFDAWSVEGVTPTSTDTTIVFTMPPNPVTVTATFIPAVKGRLDVHAYIGG